MTAARSGDWIQTFTGRQFWPLDPRPEEIFIEDIAHALSQLCRYNGHCEYLYSVAQHSIYVGRILPPELKLAGLLHDAAEAYCADVPRPIKKHLRDYAEIEARLQVAIGQRFGIDPDLFECAAVKAADNSVLLAEKRQLMKQPPKEWEEVGVPEAEIVVVPWSTEVAKWTFLETFRVYNEAHWILR